MTHTSKILIAACATSVTLGATILLSTMTGCTSTPAAVKSTSAPPTAVLAGASAQARAGSLPVVRGGPARGKRDARLETVAVFDGPGMPVGIALSRQGRTFLSFPRWLDPVRSTVVELREGQLVPFPDAATNEFDGTDLRRFPPADHLISVQSIYMDDKDRLWTLDTGSFNFGPIIQGGPKLFCYDIGTGQRVKTIRFPNDVTLKRTALNDVRFDFARGPEGTAYITDSGAGGIVVVDLATGDSWRRLDHHPSVLPAIGFQPENEGEPVLQRKPTREEATPDIRSDGIAISPDRKTLYYTSVMNRDIYSVPTDLLADRTASGAQVAAAVKKVATKPSAADGMMCDPQGNIYSADYEDNAIHRTDPATGRVEVVVQDERMIWPDTLAMHDGYLYVTVNQLARQSTYHFGKDLRQAPYGLFRIPLDNRSTAQAAR